MLSKKWKKLIIIAGIVVMLDQLTKAIILKTIPMYHSVPVIEGLFNLTHIYNTGGAFGIFSRTSPLVFLVIGFLAVCFVVYFYVQTPDEFPYLSGSLALILGGAIGNLIDRVRFGSVLDFLDFHIGSYHWPAFNVADSSISVGGFILLLHIILNKLPE